MATTEHNSRDNSLADSVALEYILLGDLQDLLGEPQPDEQTTRWIVAVLDALLDALPREMELKSEGGYLQPVLEQFPNWAGQIGDLATEKEYLFQKLHELRVQVESPGSFEVLANEIRLSLQEWMTMWTAHLRHERRILQSAFTLDVGCGD
ncbi:MAG: hypothetical protein KDA84_30290 [Planctomycetaceae bacterium]|nr:hypothetical protein [Planctomycetaceae bacterium]